MGTLIKHGHDLGKNCSDRKYEQHRDEAAVTSQRHRHVVVHDSKQGGVIAGSSSFNLPIALEAVRPMGQVRCQLGFPPSLSIFALISEQYSVAVHLIPCIYFFDSAVIVGGPL